MRTALGHVAWSMVRGVAGRRRCPQGSGCRGHADRAKVVHREGDGRNVLGKEGANGLVARDCHASLLVRVTYPDKLAPFPSSMRMIFIFCRSAR